MFKDQSLVPAEANRLAALGLLAEQTMSYADLARAIRTLTSLITGPSMDLIAPPLALLKVEGLVRFETETEDETALLSLTDHGTENLLHLLKANLRSTDNDVSKLVLSLKIRFMPFLSEAEQLIQADIVQETTERQLERLYQLQKIAPTDNLLYRQWIDFEIEQIERRAEWFQKHLDA